MGAALFIAEPTGTCRLSLRRFRYRDDWMSGGHTHDATVVIGEDEPVTPPAPDSTKPVTDDRVPRNNPRWPSCCGCGEPFHDDDSWQVNELDWYEGAGQRFCWGIGSWDGPPGAMIRAPWRDDTPDNGCPAYVVFLPNGSHWCTRDQSSGPDRKLGPQWSVTGNPPLITVSPSIDDRSSPPWHGWIRDGEMVAA
jgi:Family of unknown function (DUF6527)